MEFWGVEVKAGKPLKVEPDVGKLIHISQAALGEGKRDKGEIVPLRVNINDKKFVVGSLSAENFPQITFDLVFEKEFELSHDWKNGSVYFCGYMADNPYGEEEDDGEFDSEEEEEDLPMPIAENGKVAPKAEEVKPAAAIKGKAAKPESSAKSKVVTVVDPKKDEADSDDSEDSDDSFDDDQNMLDADSDDGSDDDSDEIDDSDESEDETPTPKKPADKKRPNQSASKTPVPAKKSKVESAQKTDGKKGGHVATPYPKKAEKTPASNKQTPKSGGAQISCGSCTKKFNSDSALQSHTKAKHAAK